MPASDGSLGDERGFVLVGVARADPGDTGPRCTDGSEKDILNCETFETFGLCATGASLETDEVVAEISGVTSPLDVVGCEVAAARTAPAIFAGAVGPTLTTSPFLSISSISFAAGCISSSLSPSSPPTSISSSSFPKRTADLSVEDCDAGRMFAPRD